MGKFATVKFEGLTELRRGLQKVDTDLAKDIRTGLKSLAVLVRDDIRSHADERFGGKVAKKIRARVTRDVALVDTSARKSANTSLRRDNFAGLLYDQAFEPGSVGHEEELARGVEEIVDRVTVRNGFQ